MFDEDLQSKIIDLLQENIALRRENMRLHLAIQNLNLTSPAHIKTGISNIFRDAARKWHPDKNKGEHVPMQAINDFYSELKKFMDFL